MRRTCCSRSPEDLSRCYPLWVHQAYAHLGSGDLLRYMNYRVQKDGRPHTQEPGEVRTILREYAAGTRVRHRIHGNVLKMYDKMGSVLRVESMLNDLTHFRVPRTDPVDGRCRRARLRKGVVDLPQRAAVSRQANDRYLETLAVVEDQQPLGTVVDGLGSRVVWHGRAVRALNPLAEADVAVLTAINRGEFLIHGFRNRDLRAVLYAEAPEDDPTTEAKRSAQVTRWLRLLRAHGLIERVTGGHVYQVTPEGRAKIAGLLAARAAGIKQLLQAG